MKQRQLARRIKAPHIQSLPQFAAVKEAPYIYAATEPGVPRARKAYLALIDNEKVEEAKQLEKRQSHRDLALKDRERLERIWKSQRERLTNQDYEDKESADLRRRLAREEREQRWVNKTVGHPFAVDQWQEDVQIYGSHLINNAKSCQRQRLAAQAVLQDQADRRKQRVEDVDALEPLRKERKKLQEDQKELKARLDLDKVERRCAWVKQQAAMREDAHLEKLASKGLFDRMASDVFTEERLNMQEQEERRLGIRKTKTKSDSWRPRFRNWVDPNVGKPAALGREEMSPAMLDLMRRTWPTLVHAAGSQPLHQSASSPELAGPV